MPGIAGCSTVYSSITAGGQDCTHLAAGHSQLHVPAAVRADAGEQRSALLAYPGPRPSVFRALQRRYSYAVSFQQHQELCCLPLRC
jgi:hypothetical protein